MISINRSFRWVGCALKYFQSFVVEHARLLLSIDICMLFAFGSLTLWVWRFSGSFSVDLPKNSHIKCTCSRSNFSATGDIYEDILLDASNKNVFFCYKED